MNKQKRDELAIIHQKLTNMLDTLTVISADVEEMKDEEQEKYDNMSEGFQQSENGQKIEAAATALDNAVSELQQMESSLQTALEEIDNATAE